MPNSIESIRVVKVILIKSNSNYNNLIKIIIQALIRMPNSVDSIKIVRLIVTKNNSNLII